MFWQEKKLRSDEFEILTKRLIVVEADVERIKRLLESNGSAVSSLRGLVNRKLGGNNSMSEESETPEVNDGFNELRKLNKAN